MKSCPLVPPSPSCHVVLGKTGDIIGLMPAWAAGFKRTGVKPVVMVEPLHAPLFEGISYAEPWVVPFKWPLDIPAARVEAARHFDRVIVPQFWNDTLPLPENQGTGRLSFSGREYKFDIEKWPTCHHAMWCRSGMEGRELKGSPVVFDRRDELRESRLSQTVSSFKKPVILYNLQGESCPFGPAPEVLASLWPLKHLFDLVDLSRIRAERFYDLVGLYDRAAGMVTIDTATMHLASASQIPYVAFTNDGWSRAVPKGNCALEISYSEVPRRLNEISAACAKMAQSKSGQRPHGQYDPNRPPSILHQTPWPVRIIDELPTHCAYFNPGLVTRPDGTWLVTRRTRGEEGNPFGKNDLAVFETNGLKITGPEIPVKTLPVTIDEHFEDPRCLYFGGKTYISCCNFVWGKVWTGAHQILTEVDANWMMTHRYDVLYGKNGNLIGRNTGMEKNWLWFFHDGRPHMVYGNQSHVVVEFDARFNKLREWSTWSEGLQWPWGQPRGGTPPVLVGEQYWSFFHSSTRWEEQGTARYHMGIYSFDAHPPFRKRRFSRRPVMSGSQLDRWAHPKPLVVFPCGAVLKDGVWTVSMGVNDLYCAMAQMPHDELVKQTVELK